MAASNSVDDNFSLASFTSDATAATVQPISATMSSRSIDTSDSSSTMRMRSPANLPRLPRLRILALLHEHPACTDERRVDQIAPAIRLDAHLAGFPAGARLRRRNLVLPS